MKTMRNFVRKKNAIISKNFLKFRRIKNFQRIKNVSRKIRNFHVTISLIRWKAATIGLQWKCLQGYATKEEVEEEEEKKGEEIRLNLEKRGGNLKIGEKLINGPMHSFKPFSSQTNPEERYSGPKNS